MSERDKACARVQADFVAATQRAAEAGFDWLELHCAQGYLLSSSISPLTKHRGDGFGASLSNRLRYPLPATRYPLAAGRDGLVQREPSPGDRRAGIVRLTDWPSRGAASRKERLRG